MFAIGNEIFTDAEFDEAFIRISEINPKLAVAVVEAGSWKGAGENGYTEGPK